MKASKSILRCDIRVTSGRSSLTADSTGTTGSGLQANPCGHFGDPFHRLLPNRGSTCTVCLPSFARNYQLPHRTPSYGKRWMVVIPKKRCMDSPTPWRAGTILQPRRHTSYLAHLQALQTDAQPEKSRSPANRLSPRQVVSRIRYIMSPPSSVTRQNQTKLSSTCFRFNQGYYFRKNHRMALHSRCHTQITA